MTEVLFEIDRNRPVEWLAVFLLVRGYIPSSAYQRSYASPASVYRSPRTSQQVTRLSASDGWLYRPIMKECSHCGEVYPEDGNMWERNAKGLNGWHSHCKNCRRDYYQRRYQRNKARRNGNQ